MAANQRVRVFWMVVIIAGAAALLGALLITPERLAALSSDGTLSISIREKLKALRLALLGLGIAGLFAGGCGRAGWKGGLAAIIIGVVIANPILSQVYPGNMFKEPKRLMAAVLGESPLLEDYDPKPRLVTPVHEVLRAKYPVINIHAHFRHWHREWEAKDLVATMDAANVQMIVDLDGNMGDSLREEVEKYAHAYPDRIIIFAAFGFGDQITDWSLFNSYVDKLEEAKEIGAKGLKIWKMIGLRTRDENGKLIPLDDVRLDRLWTKAGELELPILIHVGDPAAFFDPIDPHNERYEELKANPDWSFHGPEYPSLNTVLGQFEEVLKRHRNTTFILAHLANRTDDLSAAADLLDRHPNLSMDISARVSELGRQPRSAREFFIKYQDRLVFGTDGNPEPDMYAVYYRFLETDDEYFDYPFWPQFNYGRWKIYGIKLPDEVLRKLYYDNAAKILKLPPLNQAGAVK